MEDSHFKIHTIIKIVTVLVLTIPTQAFPGDGPCVPKDCTLQDWTRWGDCSEPCGDTGVRDRTRLILQEASCNGKCNYNTTETEPCNRKCCPRNCLMDHWYAWSCSCSTTSCTDPGARIACSRYRFQIHPSSCGGYCDDRTTEKLCNTLCCYKDCVYGSWMTWGSCNAQCEQTGTQLREKFVEQKSECGGKMCINIPQEVRECEGPCCPVDCVQGDWSQWSECPATCGYANMTRTRYVEEAFCGGKPCDVPVHTDYKGCERYNNVDCKVSPWSQWTLCELDNGHCGRGQKERIRSILVDGHCHGQSCPDLLEKKNCSGPCCVQDCVVTEWTPWTFCSSTCGKGVSQRTRNTTTEQACNGSPCPELLESMECEQTTIRDCVFGAWSEWSACNTDCGEGLKLRSRTMLTPAYCGGQCSDTKTEETAPCTSHAARQDCELSQWTQWSVCVRNCKEGERKRNRTIIQNDDCGGLTCSNLGLVVSRWSQWGECLRNCYKGLQKRYRNVTVNMECGGQTCPRMSETLSCHPECSQLCNQGVCSCQVGYELQADGYSCSEIRCKWPYSRHCPPDLKFRDACQSVKYNCPTGQSYKDECFPIGCTSEGFVVKGAPKSIYCQKNRTWSENSLYCGLVNKAPLGIEINATEIDENWPVGTCFAALTTLVDNEPYDKHVYSVVSDATGTVMIKDNRVCLQNEASYESESSREFDVKIKTTDFDGESMTKSFHMTVLNANDPPRSAKLVPNTIRENSRDGTQVGCVFVKDDDPGQTMSIFLISSADSIFELTTEGGKTCLKLAASSDPRCYSVGGKYCTLDYETRRNYYITVLVEDDGQPPMMNVFDLPITLVDVNEKPRKLSLHPKNVLEEVEPGETLAVVVVDDDVGQSHTFEILVNPSNLFAIKGDKLTASKKLDHEANKNKQYTLDIRVTDNGSPPMEATLQLLFGVGDVNESPYDLHVTSDNSKLSYETDHPRVKENVKGEIMGTLSVYDVDEDENLELKVISTYSKFSLVSRRCVPLQNVNNYCTASILMEESVDFEEVQEFHITVMATDKRKVRISNTMTIRVKDANDPPKDIILNGLTSNEVKVPEDQRSFTVATVTTVDDDKGDNHVYFLSGEAASNFRIEGDQLKTSPTANLDFETQQTTLLTLTATDDGVPSQSFQKTFTIIIVDRNEPPSDISLSMNKVSEDSPIGTVVGDLGAVDPDNRKDAGSQTFTFSLPDDGRGLFEVKGNQLVTASSRVRCGTDLCRLDFETDSEIHITVRARDNGKPRMSFDEIFIISVLDANDPPENLRLTRASLRENLPAGTIVGTLNADDTDQSQTLTFEVIDSSIFMIHDSNLLVTSRSLNYEETFSYQVKVKVTDSGSPPASVEDVMTLTVLDVNEAPDFTSISIVSVSEDADVGTVIANISVVDPDADAKISFSITKFEDDFMTTQPICSKQADSAGTVCLTSLLSLIAFDFDKHPLYSLPVVARDNKDLETQQLLTIKIVNINDPPHDILLDGISTSKIDIAENVSPLDVATMSTIDRDKGQAHTYRIKYQDGGKQFAVSGDLLRLSTAADHEVTPEIHLTLEVTDSGDVPRSLEKNITVVVKDINEQPTQLALSNKAVAENSGEGTVIGTLIAVDPDNADSNRQLFTFSLMDNADGRFRIQGDQLLVAQPNKDCLSKGGDFCHLNYEDKKTHSIQVAVADSGVPSKMNRFVLEVNITDVNDAPRNLRLSGEFVLRDDAVYLNILDLNNKVEELASSGTKVGTLTVDDEDVGQTHTFSLLGDAEGMFKIESAKSVVKATDDRLNNKKTYKIVVQATENGMDPQTTEETFYLTVTGTEEAPRDVSITSQDGVNQFSRNEPTVREDAALGSIVGTVTAVDNDPGSEITFELLDNANGHFMIETTPASCRPEGTGTLCSTHIKLSKPMDFETNPQHPIVVKAVDGQGMRSSEAFTVGVFNVNEAPVALEYIGGDITVEENHNGEQLSVLTVTDPDKDDTHVFSLTDNAAGKFIISEKGQLETSQDAQLDYESEKKLEIRVKVVDKGGLALEQTFHVYILDLNEQPDALNISINQVEEMVNAGTVVGKLTVNDPDNAGGRTVQHFTFNLLDDDGGRFMLDGDTLKIADEGVMCSVKGGTFCLFDFESQESHNIAVEVTDDGEPKLTSTFTLTIRVLDLNDPPMDLSLDKVNIPEQMDVGGVIGMLSAADQDRGQRLDFSVAGGDAADVVSVVGIKLILNKSVDFEEKPSYTVIVKVKDNGNPPSETKREFVLNVVNVNEAPTQISVEPIKGGPYMTFPVDRPIVGENEPEETVIGQLFVLDPDKDEHITAVSSSAMISIEEMGCLTLTKGTRCAGNVKTERMFDFESESSFVGNITVTDGEGKSLSQQFTFSVVDKNDPAKDILIDGQADGALTILENSVDKVVGTLTAVDPDVHQSHSFAVLNGPQFFFFVGNQLKLTTSAHLDFEKASEFVMTVSATDDGQPPMTFEKRVTIKVTDVNEAPSSVSLSKNQVSEASTVDTVVGALSTDDPDNTKTMLQTFTYTIIDDDDGRFKINGSHILVAKPDFDYESKRSTTVKVQVTDSGLPPMTLDSEFIIDIINANDQPTNLKFSASTISEDASVGTIVGTLTADDDDVGQTLSYSVGQSDLLTIREDQVLVNGLLNYEAQSSITILATVADDGEPSLSMSRNFTIDVKNVNDKPSSLELRSVSGAGNLNVSESMQVGEVVGVIVVTDEDMIERITITLDVLEGGVFKLDASGPTCSLKFKDGINMTICSINLLLADTIDFEQITNDGDTIPVDATATDKGGLTITDRWDIPVVDTNDPPTDIFIDGNIVSIPENMPNFRIGSLQSADEDRKDAHIYQVLDYWEIFKVSAEQELVASTAFNFEKKSEYKVKVKSVDSGNPPMSFTKTFTFTVSDVNEKPTNISLSHAEVSMAAPVDSVVGFVEVFDPDNEDEVGEKQTFLCAADASQNMFSINKKDNSLKVKSVLPAEEKTVQLSVTCTDNGVPPQSATADVKVKVVETADVPKSIRLDGALEVEENTSPVNIGIFSVINALNQKPISGTFVYKDVSQVKGGGYQWSITGESLVLTSPLNYEATEEVKVAVKVTGKDGKGQDVVTEETFTITVKDVNEAPTHIGIYSDSVPENSPTGTPIGDLNTVDQDTNQTYIYTLKGVARGVESSVTEPQLSSLFDIKERTLVVGLASELLDFETSSIFSLLVETVDSGSPSLSYTGTVRVLLQDRNDAPSAVQLDNNEIPEQSPVGSVVGVFNVTDQDRGQKHKCEVVNIQDVPFKVEDDLKLVVFRNQLDYEDVRNYVVQVMCQDEGGDGSFLKVSSSFTVKVTNVNDAPYNVTLSKSVLAENEEKGKVAAEISAFDPDGDKITFEIIDPTGDFTIQGDSTLVVNTVFNYEKTTLISLTLKASDPEGLSITTTFNMKIGDVNEAPSSVSLSAHSVEENASPRTVVGTFRTEDEDYSQTFTYSLSDEDLATGHFAIDGETLRTGDVPLDFEENAVYILRITSTDSGSPPLNVQVDLNITIIDVNEAPTDIITRPISAVPEDSKVGLVVTDIHVEDQETDQSYSCSVTNADTSFNIQTSNNGTMTLVLNHGLDHEATPTIAIAISCMDGPFQVTKDLTIVVSDVNEPPTEIQLDAPMLLPALGQPGYIIGQLSAVDADVHQSHTFTVRGANSDIVQVKEKNRLTLIKAIPMEKLIDQATPELVLTIEVVDNGQPSLALEQLLKFPITDIDLDALKLPAITIDNKRVPEEAEEGKVIGAMYNLNRTVGDNVVFEILEDANQLFQVKNNSYLVLQGTLVGITAPSVKVTVQARNTKTQQTTSRTITIFIIKSIKCKRNEQNCHMDAKCVILNATYEYCKCSVGFVGDGYNCKDFDDCSNSTIPCKNGATCIDALGSYSCKCALGYAGKYCEINQNEKTPCYDNKCMNDAVCVVDKSDTKTYRCICDAGWAGQFCDKSIDDCEKSYCYGGGKCVDKHLTYICECGPDRFGVRCDYLKSSCADLPCKAADTTCVPNFEREGHECVDDTAVVTLQISYITSRLDELKARLVDLIQTYGRFPSQAIHAKSAGRRKKRSDDTTSNVHAYITEVTEPSPGMYNADLMVQDSRNVVYDRTIVLISLKDTCEAIRSDGQTEAMFCPAVDEAVRNAFKEKGRLQADDGGMPIGVVAGAGGGAVVLIIVIVGVICFRKHRGNRVTNSETPLQPNENKEDPRSGNTTNSPSPPPPPPPPPPPKPPGLMKPGAT